MAIEEKNYIFKFLRNTLSKIAVIIYQNLKVNVKLNIFYLITEIKMQQPANMKQKAVECQKDQLRIKRTKTNKKEVIQVFPVLELPNEVILRISSFLTLKDLVSIFLIIFVLVIIKQMASDQIQ